jgi:hypothetical protein
VQDDGYDEWGIGRHACQRNEGGPVQEEKTGGGNGPMKKIMNVEADNQQHCPKVHCPSPHRHQPEAEAEPPRLLQEVQV